MIQDLAANPFVTASSPMIGFMPVSVAPARELSLRIYRFLIEGIREEDQTHGARFVERFLEGPQRMWGQIDTTIRSLPDMWSITKCEDRFLPYLKWIVGWTSELDYITDELDAATLRRLIATSVPFWKIRGTEDALTEILRLTTAARVRLWTWFDLRFISDETALGEENQGYDPWVLDLPGPDAFAENQMNVRIVDDGTLNHRLVRNLVKLTRPSGERITISYIGFLDLFNVDDDSSQWTTVTSFLLLPPTVANGSMTLASGNYVFANPSAAFSWQNYVVSVRAKGTKIAVDGYFTAAGDSYLVLVDVENNRVEIYVHVAGVPTLLGFVDVFSLEGAFGTPFPSGHFGTLHGWILDPELFYTVRVAFVPENAQTRITVWLDGNFIISVVDGSHAQGTIALPGVYSSGDTVIAEVEMFFNPLEEDFVDIVIGSGDEDDEE